MSQTVENRVLEEIKIDLENDCFALNYNQPDSLLDIDTTVVLPLILAIKYGREILRNPVMSTRQRKYIQRSKSIPSLSY